MGTITVGVDLAKQVFSVCEAGESGRVLCRRDLRRDAFAAWLAQLPTGSVVGDGSLQWRAPLGQVLCGPWTGPALDRQFVKPFCK